MDHPRMTAATVAGLLLLGGLAVIPTAGADTTNFYTVEEIPPEDVNTTGWFEEALLDDMAINSQIPPTPFFDTTVDEIWWVSNGYVAMGDYDGRTSSTGCCQGGPIPQDDDVNGIIAGAWTDLDPSQPCGSVKRNITQDAIRVKFTEVPYFDEGCGPDSNRTTFWIEILPSNGTVEVHLLRADGGIITTTGIESIDGTTGNQTRRTDAELAAPIAWRMELTEGTPPPDEPLEQDDAGSGGDAGDDDSTALPITEGTYTGTLDPDFNDTEDWYAIDLVEGDEIAVDLDPDGDFEVALHDPNGTEIARSGAFDGTEHVEATAAENGTHYVRIFAESGEGDYTFTVDVAPPVEPRVEQMDFRGTIDCAVDVLFVETGDVCAVAPPARDETFPVGFDRGLTSIRTQLVWSQDAAISPAERMEFTWTNLPGLQDAEGPSPVVRVQDTSGIGWTETSRGGWIEVAPTQATGAVVDQPFDLCIWAAYGGATLPADPACG